MADLKLALSDKAIAKLPFAEAKQYKARAPSSRASSCSWAGAPKRSWPKVSFGAGASGYSLRA